MSESIKQSLSILFEDEHFVAVDKPNGLLVHRTRMAADVQDFALQRLRKQIKQRIYPVHRLDRPTSGVLIFARSSASAKPLAEQFEEHEVRKSYIAVVRGYAPEEGEVTNPLRKDLTGPRQDAHTKFTRLATVELPYPVGRYETARYSMVKVEPLSGRMHQIRRHLKHLRYPIIGDRDYGDRYHNRFFRDELGWPLLFLHAHELSFEHPFNGGSVRITAQLPDHLKAFMAKAGWSLNS